jgi:hypothetical protein
MVDVRESRIDVGRSWNFLIILSEDWADGGRAEKLFRR